MDSCRIMKKFISILLSVIIVPAFVGCDGKAGRPEKPVLAERTDFRISSSSGGVGDFLELNTGFVSSYDNEVCRNITPDYVAENSAYSVFKYDRSCASFLLYDGNTYMLGEYFGGFGVTSVALADMNGDGEYELYFAFSWGSGLHRSQAGYFDPAEKKIGIFDYARVDGDLVLKTNDDGELLLCGAVFTGGTFTDFALEAGDVAAAVVYKDRTIGLEPAAESETKNYTDEIASLTAENNELRNYIRDLEKALNEDGPPDIVTVEGLTGIGPENGAGEYGYIIVNGDCRMFPYYGHPVSKFKGYLFGVQARYSVHNSSGSDDMWLLISPVMPGYMHSGLQQYWILESDALQYTEETKNQLRAPLFITEGTLDADGKEIELPYPNVWILTGTQEGRAHIGAMGGRELDVNQSDIVYPDPEIYSVFNLNG